MMEKTMDNIIDKVESLGCIYGDRKAHYAFRSQRTGNIDRVSYSALGTTGGLLNLASAQYWQQKYGHFQPEEIRARLIGECEKVGDYFEAE